LYIITKKTSPSKIALYARLQEETVGKEYGIQEGIHTQSVGATFRHKKWEAGGGFSYNYFGGWKDTAVGREIVWHWKDQLTANGFVGYNSGRFNIRYRIDGLDEIITNPGNFTSYQADAGDSVAFDQEYLSQRIMHQLQAGYSVNNDLSFSAQAAYSDYSRQVYSTVVSQNTGKYSLNPVPETQSLVNFNSFTFRGTAQYKLSPVFSFQPGVDINLESGNGERLKMGSNKVDDYAFFFTSEITPNSKINIRPGIRVIKNSVYDAPPVIPSINTKFALSKNLDLRIAYARGFRSPSLRELYFNFFDANHQIIGNPDLKAETSHSFTGSLSWKKISPSEVAYTTIFSGFYNNVTNLIDYAVSANDPNIFILTNVSKSKTAGVSLTSVVKYKNWNVAVGGSYTGFYNVYVEEDKELPQLQWSAEANTNIGYNFSKIGLDANLFYKFTGKKPGYVFDNTTQEYIQSEMKGYHMADFTMNKKLFKHFSLNAGAKNIFNVKSIKNSVIGNSVHASNGISNIAYGRSYFAGLSFNWNKK